MHSTPEPGTRRLSFFERYLSLWVALCIVAGVLSGTVAPGLIGALSRMEVHQVNLPIAVLIWLMIYPMMLRIDFAALRGVGQRPKGLLVVLFVNWLVKPFSMAFLAWLFFKQLFAGLIGPGLADQYVAGTIILAAAPCTAMVFVWSYLTDGDPAYTLVQVALNDRMLVAFAPIVIFLQGVSNITVPYDVLLYSVVLYIVIPRGAGALSRAVLRRGRPSPPSWACSSRCRSCCRSAPSATGRAIGSAGWRGRRPLWRCPPTPLGDRPRQPGMNRQRVLFLCTHNSSRSQMAEGFLRRLAGDRFEGPRAVGRRDHGLGRREGALPPSFRGRRCGC